MNTLKPNEKFNTLRSIAIIFITILIVIFPMLSKASSTKNENHNCSGVTNRPLSDFLETQGTLNNPPQFFPQVKDYVGWAGDNGINFALVDYAGLANKYIEANGGPSLGTKVNGFIIECHLPDGGAKVTVTLLTTKALGFAQSIQNLIDNNFNFLNTPTIFGSKAQDVANGTRPSLGPVVFSTTFTIVAPGAPLPDFLDVVNTTNYAPAKYSFKSTTFGTCSNNNTRAHLTVHQEAFTNNLNEWVYTEGIVDVVDKKGKDCIN